MDVKIAFATSDGKNVDTHFGMASAFQIYQLVDGTFTFIEERVVPTESKNAEQNQDCGQKSSSGCGDGSGHGCSCGGAESSPAVDLLLDCTAVVAARFGRNVIRQFERHAISVFDVEVPVDEALKKLSAYYSK